MAMICGEFHPSVGPSLQPSASPPPPPAQQSTHVIPAVNNPVPKIVNPVPTQSNVLTNLPALSLTPCPGGYASTFGTVNTANPVNTTHNIAIST